MFTDKLTPGERMRNLFARKPIDRVPVIPFSKGYSAKIAGINRGEFYRRPEQVVAAAQVVKKRHPGLDGKPSYGWADTGGWEFGGKIRFPDKEKATAPMIIEPPIQTVADAYKIEIPDPRTAGLMPLFFQLNKMFVKMGLRPSFYGTSPVNYTASMVGKDRMLRWMIKEPDALHVALKKATEFQKRTVDWYISEFGAENLDAFLGYPIENNKLISPEQFKEFCVPYIKEIHEYLFSRGFRMFLEHICGEHHGNMKYWKEVPFYPRSVITVGDEMNLKEMASFFGDDYIIAGNVSTQILAIGSVAEVKAECIRCLDEVKHHRGGFAIMPACEMPPDTPPENVDEMLRVAREYGAY